jgi:hypothetical protein
MTGEAPTPSGLPDPRRRRTLGRSFSFCASSIKAGQYFAAGKIKPRPYDAKPSICQAFSSLTAIHFLGFLFSYSLFKFQTGLQTRLNTDFSQTYLGLNSGKVGKDSARFTTKPIIHQNFMDVSSTPPLLFPLTVTKQLGL